MCCKIEGVVATDVGLMRLGVHISYDEYTKLNLFEI